MAYVFQKTEDIATIKAVLAHPSLYRFLHDDFAPPREEWEPPIHPMVHYYAVRSDRQLIGMFMCNQHSAVEVEIHTAFLPCAWGRHVRSAAKEFQDWIWDHTDIQRIIGKVVSSNVASLNYAESLGFKVFGVDRRSKMYDGELQDQIYYGISRPGVE